MHASLAEHAESPHSSDCNPAVIALCVVPRTIVLVPVVNRISCVVAPFSATVVVRACPRVCCTAAGRPSERFYRRLPLPVSCDRICALCSPAAKRTPFLCPRLFFFSFRVCVCVIFLEYGCRRRPRRAAFRPDDAGCCCCAAFLRISPKFAPLKEADSHTF